ncbi:hypothetical protein Tco_0544934 [Tanacetum coccineum]
MDKGTQNYSLDHMFEGTNPSVLVDKTKSARDGLKTAHTEIGANLETSKAEKDNVDIDFIGLDSLKDDEPIIVQDDSDEEVHAEKNSKLKEEKTKAEDKVALLSAQPSYLNMAQLTELLLKKHVPDLEIELLEDLKEIPNKLETFTSTVKCLTTQVVELKTLQWELPAEFLSIPIQVIEYTSKKTGDTGVPSASQASSHPTKGEKNTQHVTISYLPKSSSQPEGELIKKDKGKEAMSSKDAKEEKTKSDSNDTINLTGSMVESSKKKKLKKFDFVTEEGDHVHFTKEQIKEQKRIEESVKVDLAKQEVEIRKEEWIDLLGVDVACPNRKGAGWATIYEQTITRIDYLQKTKAKLGIDLDKPLGEQDPIDKLNDLGEKRKHADDIY